ncbi:LysR family transcriptional regulator [Salmonella enterica]|nr:LysR family transcriptional regulator [Salmonella enterica]
MGIFISRKMRYFMVLMEKKNFAKAAEELCITRSPLSKVVAEIEDSFGDKLFYRKYNELVPTELAWDHYEHCKQLYDTLLKLESEHKARLKPKRLTFRFDISTPEIFVRHIDIMAKAENLNITISREIITIDDLTSLPYDNNQAIFSIRTLGEKNLVTYDSWEGSNIVELSSKRNNKNAPKNNYFVWKDSNQLYFKNRFTSLLKYKGITPEFIAHNYDISTLLLMVRIEKGKVIASEKFATWYKNDEINIERLNSHVRCHLYYNDVSGDNRKTIMEIKRIINKFI